MARMTNDETDKLLQTIFAPWIVELGLHTVRIDDEGVTFSMPARPSTVHAGGVICGQTIAAAADTAAVAALCAHNGSFRMVTTVDLSVHFVRPLPPGETHIRTRIDSNGKRMAYVRAEVSAKGSDKIAATFSGAFMYLE